MNDIQWIELAEERADNSRPKLYLAGGILGALLAGSLLNPLTAGLVLAWGAYAAYRANEENSDLLEAIDTGILAPVMDKKQLRDYRAAVGDEAVQRELSTAIAQELPLSPAAAALAKSTKVTALALAPTPTDTAPESTAAPMLATVASIDLGSMSDDCFDWALLKDSDRYPHLLMLGATGAGKTTLARRLVAYLGGAAIAITPHAKPGEWGELQVIGAGRDYRAISKGIASLVTEMNRRYTLFSQGQEDYPVWVVVVDEVPAIMGNCPTAGDALKALAREARKVKIRLLILSQGGEVKALGIEGEGSVRESFTKVYLRGFIPPGIAYMVAGEDYPCVISGQRADVSALPEMAFQPRFNPVSTAPPETTPETLEALLERDCNGSETSVKRFGADALTLPEMQSRIAALKGEGWGQTRIIESLWAVKAGGSNDWRVARREYSEITGE